MSWRERLVVLLGAASPFAIGGSAGATLPQKSPQAERGGDEAKVLQPLDFWRDPAHAGHLRQLARHGSHVSHASHASHASHYSGSGASLPRAPAPVYSPPVYSPPAPVYAPPPASSAPPPRATAPTAPPIASSRTAAPAEPARLSQDDISKFVQRVQIALIIKGFDPGPADGALSPMTRDALKAFQSANQLSASGNMDVDTLHALGVLK